MVDHRQVEILCILHRPPHNAGIRNGPAIVRDRYRTGRLHFAHLGEFGTIRGLCDRPDREDVGQARVLGLLDHVAGDGGVVIDRIGVRHRANGRPTAGRGRRTTRGDRFLMLLPRLTQVNMQIDKPRSDK